MKAKILFGSVAAVLVIGILAATIWWLRRPQIITLSDGMKLTLLGVEYGKHHKYPTVKTAGHAHSSGGPTAFDTPDNALVVWILAEHKANQWPNFQVLAYDPAATACVGNWSHNSRQIKNGMDVLGIQFDAFPRRSRKMDLRIMNWGPRGQQVAKGQFVVSNPVRGTFPQWTPSPLPCTQSDGDLDVTLTRLVYGVEGFNRGSSKMKNDPLTKAVLAAFRIEQKGIVVTNWQPVRIGTSDATGNQIENNSWSNTRANDESVMTYQWGLWPDEPAWKLRVEMSRTSGFHADELWTIENVPVQPGRQSDFWNHGGNGHTNAPFAETTLNGIHLKLYPAAQFTDQNFNGQKQGGFRIVANPPPAEGFRLTLAKATDEQGRAIESWNPSWGGGDYGFQLQNLRNAKTLNLTLALHQSRFVEFTARPQQSSGGKTP